MRDLFMQKISSKNPNIRLSAFKLCDNIEIDDELIEVMKDIALNDDVMKVRDSAMDFLQAIGCAVYESKIKIGDIYYVSDIKVKVLERTKDDFYMVIKVNSDKNYRRKNKSRPFYVMRNELKVRGHK